MLNKNLIPRPKRKTALPPEQTVVVQGDHITLGQLLKTADIISSGGEAKLYLADMIVLVNGEEEQRRGRKLRAGDLVVAPDAAPIRLVAAPQDTNSLSPIVPEALSTSPVKTKNKPGGDVRSGVGSSEAAGMVTGTVISPQESAGDV